MLAGVLSAFGLGFGYFLAAIPAGAAAGAPVWLSALAAWAGYTVAIGLVAFGGEPLRNWILRRTRVSTKPDESKLFWRLWRRYGLFGLGLAAPVTVGPQIGGVLAIALGGGAPRVVLAFSLGVVPWCVAFGLLTALGFKAVG